MHDFDSISVDLHGSILNDSLNDSIISIGKHSKLADHSFIDVQNQQIYEKNNGSMFADPMNNSIFNNSQPLHNISSYVRTNERECSIGKDESIFDNSNNKRIGKSSISPKRLHSKKVSNINIDER